MPALVKTPSKRNIWVVRYGDFCPVLREGGSELFRNFYKAQNCRKLLEKTGQNFAKKPKDLLNQETLINPLPERGYKQSILTKQKIFRAKETD